MTKTKEKTRKNLSKDSHRETQRIVTRRRAAIAVRNLREDSEGMKVKDEGKGKKEIG
jgi:hypothetical protein